MHCQPPGLSSDSAQRAGRLTMAENQVMRIVSHLSRPFFFLQMCGRAAGVGGDTVCAKEASPPPRNLQPGRRWTAGRSLSRPLCLSPLVTGPSDRSIAGQRQPRAQAREGSGADRGRQPEDDDGGAGSGKRERHQQLTRDFPNSVSSFHPFGAAKGRLSDTPPRDQRLHKSTDK